MESVHYYIYHDGQISKQQLDKEMIGEANTQLCLNELKAMWLKHTDKKQIVLYIDGLGWHQLKAAESMCPYLASFHAQCCLSSWPPITNTALATMLSGSDASVHQIRSHANRSLTRSTIFDEYPKSCVYIEGERTILKIKQKAILNPRDKSDSDRAVLACLKAHLHDDFIFVHIHGYDDICHQVSPNHQQAVDKLKWLDEQLACILKEVEGYIWLVSDHGQHECDAKGEHGQFCEEDMLVPIGLREMSHD